MTDVAVAVNELVVDRGGRRVLDGLTFTIAALVAGAATLRRRTP